MGRNVHNVQSGLATENPAKAITSIAYSPIEAAKAIGTTQEFSRTGDVERLALNITTRIVRFFYLHDDLVAWVTMFPVMTKDAYDIAVQ
jgi:hypothetical protein